MEQGAQWAVLMLAAQRGDTAAYKRLLRELRDYLRPFLLRRLGNQAYIDDIVQEVLIGVHRARLTFDSALPFLPWFHAIVRYKTIDALRQRKRLQAHEIIDESALENYAETFAPAATKRELDEEILRALAALPPKQKLSLELMKLQGLSAKEAGQQLGMSESAIKVSAHRAYKALRQRFLGEKK